MDKWISPLGSSAKEAAGRRYARSPAYREQHDRLAAYRAIAGTVILARGRKGWTQARLAREIGTTGSVISRLESGDHQISVATLRRLANALGVTFTIEPDPA